MHKLIETPNKIVVCLERFTCLEEVEVYNQFKNNESCTQMCRHSTESCGGTQLLPILALFAN